MIAGTRSKSLYTRSDVAGSSERLEAELKGAYRTSEREREREREREKEPRDTNAP
jgi:hypothetical protein